VESSHARQIRLGCVCDGRGAVFSVFSSVARKVEVCLFDKNGAERRHELSEGAEGIWTGYVDGVENGSLYGYRVHGPWEPAAGHLCLPDVLLLDPYAAAVHGDVRWHDSLFPYDRRNPLAPAGRGDTAPYAPRSVALNSSFDWGADAPPDTKIEDTIIYETHVRGFTVAHPGIPHELRGTYAALGHPAAVGHLTGLGVTAVELLPVQHFIHRRPLVEKGLRNYWGYDPVCFFAPHGEYAFDRSPGGAVKELKSAIKSLHAAGIEVLIDVVFNHTGEGGADGAHLCYKGLDNRAYYHLAEGDELRYMDYTGTRNSFNGGHPQVRRMIVDALVHWVDEMHVDGFRFDLAPAMARENGSVRLDGALLEAIRATPSLDQVKLIAEPWDLGEDGYQVGRFPAGWSEWNDRFQDDVRDYWNGRAGSAGRFMLRLSGSPDVYAGTGRPPQSSVNYVTCHDGFTLDDLVSYEIKRNESNLEGGRDGRDDNHAWNCGMEGPTDDPGVNAVRARQKRNFIATLLLSQGVPMVLGGDELGRTQNGNNNPYCQDNETSWYDWSAKDAGLMEFVRRVVSLRAGRRDFRRSDWPSPGKRAPGAWTMTWYGPSGGALRDGAVPDSPRAPLQGRLSGGGDFLLLFNPSADNVTFEPPPSCGSGLWRMAVDTFRDPGPPEHAVALAGWPVVLAPHSMVVLSRVE
jgi:isoamylase